MIPAKSAPRGPVEISTRSESRSLPCRAFPRDRSRPLLPAPSSTRRRRSSAARRPAQSRDSAGGPPRPRRRAAVRRARARTPGPCRSRRGLRARGGVPARVVFGSPSSALGGSQAESGTTIPGSSSSSGSTPCADAVPQRASPNPTRRAKRRKRHVRCSSRALSAWKRNWMSHPSCSARPSTYASRRAVTSTGTAASTPSIA